MKKTHITAPNRGQLPPVMVREVGGTTFRVTASYSPKARETAHEKVLRLILENSDKNEENTSK